LIENNIEIEYRPIKKIVILNLVELDKEELFKRASAIRMVEQPIFLNWAEGIVFIAIPASLEITEVDDNVMKGIAYFEGVTYSIMPKYQPETQVAADKIPIVDQSRFPVFRAIANWINKRKNL